jgi:hypothetical protein
MGNKVIYTHQLSGRRPAMVFALAAGLAMAGFGWVYNAPWYFLAPALLVVAMAGFAIALNPLTGSRLTRQTLHFYNRDAKRDIPVSIIASVHIEAHLDGGPSAMLTLKSGEMVHVPAMCIDQRFEAAMATVGVR